MPFVRMIAVAVLSFASIAAAAADLGAATFSDMRARPTPGKIGVAFFTVTVAKDDTMIGARSDCCDAVELHRSEIINGVMSMRRIAKLGLDDGEPMRVQPDAKYGEHLMLIGLKKPLTEGDVVSVTFTFEKAGDQTVAFPVSADTDPKHTH